jgi:CubicO group peptidase (beta-lactamase class C family)
MAKRQFHVLYRDFLRRLIDVELLSIHARGDASTLFGQFVSLLIFLSLLFSVPALYFSGKLAVPGQIFLVGVWSLQHFLIATTMLLVGLFAVLTWNSTFPDKRDLLILGPLPVRTRTLFLAKIAAVGTGLGLLILTLHAMAGLVWPFAFNRHVPAQTLPVFASDPAIAPVEASEMQSVMNRDLKQAQQTGVFAHSSLAIGVVKHGVGRVFTYGTAKPDSIFEIASVTKTFTALALARMAQEGKVSLDEPVRLLLPPGTVEKPAGSEITLLDLATHHSGLPRMPSTFHPADKDNPFANYHEADLYEYIAKHGVSKPANASFRYSNVGVGLLGQVLANRAHMSYADLVRTEVTDPLGLKDTVVPLSPDQRSRFLQGHNDLSDGPDGFRRASHGYGDPVPAWGFDTLAGAGALHSTANDMLAYIEANLHPSAKGGALSAALLETQKLHADVDIALGMRIGLIWLHTPDGCYLHDGGSPGFTTFIFFNPKEDYGAVVLSNLLFASLVGEHIHQRLAGLPALSLASVNIPATGGTTGLIRLFAVYWFTMLAAGAFIYCSVLALQGLAMQLLPRQWFLRVSSILQLGAFCLLVSFYFLQPLIAAPNPFDIHSAGLPDWSPSYWFLGLFQQLNGSPALGPLATRAWIGLAIATGTTAAAYALSYLRSMRQIVEEPDILRRARLQRWLPGFGTSLETALVQFSIRTLLRSRQHRVILAFYLGIGFGATVFLLRSPIVKEISTTVVDPWRQVSVPLLAASIILMGFWVVGMRAVFSLPLDLPANWIFRMTPVHAGLDCVSSMRRSLWTLSVAPAWAISAIVFLAFWPWRPAAGHLILLALLGIAIAELCLLGSQKIPFTCSWLPGKSNFHITFWVCILLILEIVLKITELELRAGEPGLLRRHCNLLSRHRRIRCLANVTIRRGRDRKAGIRGSAFLAAHHVRSVKVKPSKLYMCSTCLYALGMSKMMQIRDVPDRVHSVLKARAAREGMSLSDFIKRELERVAARPSMREWLDGTRQAKPIPTKMSPAQVMRDLRDSR